VSLQSWSRRQPISGVFLFCGRPDTWPLSYCEGCRQQPSQRKNNKHVSHIESGQSGASVKPAEQALAIGWKLIKQKE
jgi:hypothetical protein